MPASSTRRSAGSASAAASRSPTVRAASIAPPASRSASLAGEFQPSATQRKLIRRHPTSRSPPASRGRPRSNMRCSAAIWRAAIPAAAWPTWTRATLPTWSSRARSSTYVVEYREPPVDGRPGRLVGACLTDQQADGLWMIYSFFDVGARRAARASAPTSSSTISSAPRAPACPMSISAIGSRVRRAWPTRRVPAARAARPRRLAPHRRDRPRGPDRAQPARAGATADAMIAPGC